MFLCQSFFQLFETLLITFENLQSNCNLQSWPHLLLFSHTPANQSTNQPANTIPEKNEPAPPNGGGGQAAVPWKEGGESSTTQGERRKQLLPKKEQAKQHHPTEV